MNDMGWLCPHVGCYSELIQGEDGKWYCPSCEYEKLIQSKIQEKPKDIQIKSYRNWKVILNAK